MFSSHPTCMASAQCTRPFGILALLALGSTIAFAPLTGATIAQAAFTQCADGEDNDDDGRIDYPQDVDCTSLEDNTEGTQNTAVFVSLTDGLETVYPGGTVNYVITITTDRNEQSSSSVRLQLPHQANIVSAEGGTVQGSQIVWNSVTIQPGTPRKLYASVQVNPYAAPDLLLVAEVVTEGKKAADTTRVIIKPIETAPSPLIVSITDGKQFAEPGESLTYKIVVANENHEDRVFTLRTQLPTELEFISASDGPVVNNRVVEWTSRIVRPGKAAEFTLSTKIRSGTPDLQALRVRVTVDGKVATDTTSVFRGVLPGAYIVSISDGQEITRPGETLTYNIVLKNRDDKLGTDVDLLSAIPMYTEFVSATDGGVWDGKSVHWKGITVSPKGERAFRMTLRVRSDAPLGARLQNTVQAKGHQAVDITEVSKESDKPVIKEQVVEQQRNVLLRKTSDRGEVRPGDTVNYTVYLRNTTGKTIRNVVVEDRMDLKYMTVTGGEGGVKSADRIVWTIREMAPGEEWTVRYTVRVAENTPHGISLANVVSVRGDGMEELSLTQRVLTTKVSVVRKLPPTGAAFDAIFLAVSGLLGTGSVVWQRRQMLGA